jgi:4-diphosphocytidyl-2-C-methyl-D-erythritol kinase
MKEASFYAPAKINLCLQVLGKRADGYHELAMAMQPVNLCDDITIRVGSGSTVRAVCTNLELSVGEENIAVAAARLLLDKAGCDVAVELEIDKKIPVAAGLGGGSSDAAAVLLGLTEMLELPFRLEELAELGARLGADVPFFIFRRAAWATGIGTQLEPLGDLPKVAYLLANPRVAVSTSEVYRSLELTGQGEVASVKRFSVNTLEELCVRLRNDLESVVLPRYPQVAEVKQALLDYGADGALMSGSGATVFGVFADLQAAQEVADALSALTDWWLCPVQSL